MYQTHTNNVIRVGETPLERFYVGSKTPSGVDGLVTNVPGVVLTTSFADCIPLLFADPVKKCIGLSHAGWRGTVGKIAKNTIDKMINEYGLLDGEETEESSKEEKPENQDKDNKKE